MATKHEWYVNVLQHLMDSDNHTVHSSTGVAADKMNGMNAEEVWRKMYKFPSKKKKKIDTKPGDLVRISKTKKTFE